MELMVNTTIIQLNKVYLTHIFSIRQITAFLNLGMLDNILTLHLRIVLNSKITKKSTKFFFKVGLNKSQKEHFYGLKQNRASLVKPQLGVLTLGLQINFSELEN